jgi:hypothetical protein
VTLTVDSQLTGFATVSIINPTVTSDSNGKGTFNVGITMVAPATGSTHADSIVYKAVTTETAPIPPNVSYATCVATLSTSANPASGTPPPPPSPIATTPTTPPAPTPAALAITPTTAVFGAGGTLNFTISGGVGPYTVTSSNTARFTVALQPDGVTVVATLVDKGTFALIGTITVVDSAGNTVAAVITR